MSPLVLSRVARTPGNQTLSALISQFLVINGHQTSWHDKFQVYECHPRPTRQDLIDDVDVTQTTPVSDVGYKLSRRWVSSSGLAPLRRDCPTPKAIVYHRTFSSSREIHSTVNQHVQSHFCDIVASASEAGDVSYRRLILAKAAETLDTLHDTTGVSDTKCHTESEITAQEFAIMFYRRRLMQVRTNYQIYKEAVGLTDKQLGRDEDAADNDKPGAPRTIDTVSSRKRTKLLLANFGLLRTKLKAPHPAWILLNPMIQIPCFVVMGATLRMMGGRGWPGLESGGAAWFPDLTQVALIPGSWPWSLDNIPWEFPMGALGPVLPLTLLTLTLTSLRLGFGAAGAASNTQLQASSPPTDFMGRGLRALPYILGSLAILNTWVALQLPHAALMHWTASATFTLGLQLALQQPKFRAAFNLPSPSEVKEMLDKAVNQRLLQISETGGMLGPGRGYAVSSLPDSVLKQVSGEKNVDVLVILGAQHSAAKRYREALYCLDKALQLEPTHVRAHYSRGQVFSLNNRWPDAEACFRRAAELSRPGPEQGQALYCVATALHTQGKLDAAVPEYLKALQSWPGQAVVIFSLANLLMEQNMLYEASQLLHAILSPDSRSQSANTSVPVSHSSANATTSDAPQSSSQTEYQTAPHERDSSVVEHETEGQRGERSVVESDARTALKDPVNIVEEGKLRSSSLDMQQLLSVVAGVKPGPFERPLRQMLLVVTQKLAGA